MRASSQSVLDSIADASALARIALGWGVLADLDAVAESTLGLIDCPCGGIDCAALAINGASIAASLAFRAIPGLR